MSPESSYGAQLFQPWILDQRIPEHLGVFQTTREPWDASPLDWGVIFVLEEAWCHSPGNQSLRKKPLHSTLSREIGRKEPTLKELSSLGNQTPSARHQFWEKMDQLFQDIGVVLVQLGDAIQPSVFVSKFSRLVESEPTCPERDLWLLYWWDGVNWW